VRGEGSFFARERARAILGVVARRESRDEGRAHRCTKSRANKSLWHRRAQTQLCNAATLSDSIYVTVARYCRAVTPARRSARVDSFGMSSSAVFNRLTCSRNLSVYLDKLACASRSPRYNRGNRQDRRQTDCLNWTFFGDNYLISFTFVYRGPLRELLDLDEGNSEGRKRATVRRREKRLRKTDERIVRDKRR